MSNNKDEQRNEIRKKLFKEFLKKAGLIGKKQTDEFIKNIENEIDKQIETENIKEAKE